VAALVGKDFEPFSQLQCSRKLTRFHQPILMIFNPYCMDSAKSKQSDATFRRFA